MATIPPPAALAALLQRAQGGGGPPGGAPGGAPLPPMGLPPGGAPGLPPGAGMPMGGPPGMAPPGMAPPGMAPPGAPPGGPQTLNRMGQLGRQPSPGGEAQAMRDAMAYAGFAMARYQMRAPEVARELATAMVHIKKALEKAAALPDTNVASPPPGYPAGGMAQGPGLGLPGGPALGI